MDRITSTELLRYSNEYFDPQHPEALRAIVTVGGLGVFMRLLTESQAWETQRTTSSSRYRRPVISSEPAVRVRMLALKVLLEGIICDPQVAWYYIEACPGLIPCVVDLARMQIFRETAVLLVEHVLSVVGPALSVSSLPLNRGPREGGGLSLAHGAALAGMSRVMALSLSPTAMVGASGAPTEPTTQALARVTAMERIAGANAAVLRSDRGLIADLLSLLLVSSSSDEQYAAIPPAAANIHDEPRRPRNDAGEGAPAMNIPDGGGVAPAMGDLVVDEEGERALHYITEENPVTFVHVVGQRDSVDFWLRSLHLAAVPISMPTKTSVSLFVEWVQSMEGSQREDDSGAGSEVVGSQSEIYFVLNALISGADYECVWLALSEAGLLRALPRLYDLAFKARSTWLRPVSRTEVEYVADVTSDIYRDASDEHRHDQDTLRKLEMQRLSHEYLEGQSATEVRRIASEDQCESIMKQLVTRITITLKAAREDPCTETVALHTLEMLHRCHGVLCEDDGALVGHLLHRVYNGTLDAGHSLSLIPAKRHDAVMALLGEAVKWTPWHWDAFARALDADDRPRVPARVLSGCRFGRGADDSLAQVLMARLRNFPEQSHLFLRGVLLNAGHGVSGSVNYVDVQHPLVGWSETAPRGPEGGAVQLQTLRAVKTLSRRLVLRLRTATAVDDVLGEFFGALGSLPSASGRVSDLIAFDRGASSAVRVDPVPTTPTARQLQGLQWHADGDRVASADAVVDRLLGPPDRRGLALRRLVMCDGLDPECLDGPERLWTVTSTILLCMHERFRGRLDDVLASACVGDGGAEHAQARPPRPPAVDPLRQYGDRGAMRDDVGEWNASHRGTFPATYLRQLCAWFALYATTPCLVSTLYLSTCIPFGEWRHMAMSLMRMLMSRHLLSNLPTP